MPPINLLNMPEEILLKIFLLGTSKYDRQKGNMIPLNISHTNRALRQFALSSPCLWAKIYLFLDAEDDSDERLSTRALDREVKKCAIGLQDRSVSF